MSESISTHKRISENELIIEEILRARRVGRVDESINEYIEKEENKGEEEEKKMTSIYLVKSFEYIRDTVSTRSTGVINCSTVFK